jgi:hypothetical protein
MCFGFFSVVPGFTSYATRTIITGSFSHLLAPRAEMNILEINEKLHCQLEDS